MFKTNLKIAIRNLVKYKMFSFINLTGLIIGITASLLMLMYVANELSFEGIHENRGRIYRVNSNFGSGDSGMKLAGASTAVAPAAESGIPAVEMATRFLSAGNTEIKYKDKLFNEQEVFYADPSIFKIFSFPILKGPETDLLNDPYSVVITESIAEKVFGNENPVGKILKCGDNDLTVKAVARDIPENTQLQWDCLFPISLLEKTKSLASDWQNFGNCYTYLLLKKNASDAELGASLNNLLIENAGKETAGFIKLYPQKLTDIYLHADAFGEPGLKGNITYVYLFSTVAFLILIIACFNFMNLSTARSFHRAREVGVKKVLGATRYSLAKQFLSESFLLALIAVIVSAVLYGIISPVLSEYLGYRVIEKIIYNYHFYFILFGVTFISGVFSGIYPAVILSKFKPVTTLKGALKQNSAGAPARKFLVVFQFAAAIFLIVATLTIFRQLNFMKNADLGFDKSDLVLINSPGSSGNSEAKYKLLKENLELNPDIKSVSGVYTLPGINSKEMQTIQLSPDEKNNKVMRSIGVDYDFLQTLGMKLVSGRSFSKDYFTDAQSSIILNEAAVKNLELKDPVGRSLFIPGGNGVSKEVKIVGVIKDFHISSLKDEIEPVFMYINPSRFLITAVKTVPGRAGEVIPYIKQVWTEIFPEKPIDYSFMDQKYAQLYSSEEKLAKLFTVFSVLAIFVASLGLFGLSAFTTEVKTKEIGIRKVLGAGIPGISILLSKQFVFWILIANIFALPVSVYAINKWLQNFAYRVSLDWITFLIASTLVLIISLFAISIQIIRAAVKNPVESLRYE